MMPRTKNKTEEPKPQKKGWSKCQIEAATPLAIAFMGFILGLTIIITGNNSSGTLTLASGAITGACGVASSNSKDDRELELEHKRYMYSQSNSQYPSDLGNYDLINKDYEDKI